MNHVLLFSHYFFFLEPISGIVFLNNHAHVVGAITFSHSYIIFFLEAWVRLCHGKIGGAAQPAVGSETQFSCTVTLATSI